MTEKVSKRDQKKKIKKRAFGFFLSFLAVGFFCYAYFSTSSVRAEDCRDLEGDAKKECEKLEEKAKVYENMIKISGRKQGALLDQLNLINKEQQKIRQDLSSTTQKSQTLEEKISSLESDISEKEKEIKLKKAILSGLIQVYFDYDQQGFLEIALASEAVSDFWNQSDYLEQSQAKLNEILSQIQRDQNQLVRDRDSLQSKKDELEKAKEDLDKKNKELQSSRWQKNSLLVQTQGEEEKYRQLLERVEKQKLELFNFSEASNISELTASVKDYPKPKEKDWAPTSWYFSQRDSRWGDSKIGNSKSLMKDYGCAISCVAMVFRKNGSPVDPGKMAKQPIFYYDLIKWPSSWEPGIKLVSSTYHGNVSWSKIDKEIKDGNPVIIYIKKTNGRGGHYVTITGKDSKDYIVHDPYFGPNGKGVRTEEDYYIVHDPYFGPNLYLGTSKSLVGKLGVNSGTVIDQMIIYN